jgi:2-desacetyl-2-hydroxyethyl bacteriochlorophyllide A dehydrogenase
VKAVRASIFAEQSVRFENFELPDRAEGAQLVVKVDRTIISAGTELANYTGLDSDTRVPGAWCCYPWIPGYGGVGRVISVGPDAKGFSVGQRVYGIAKHADYGVVDTSWELCMPVPNSLDSTEAVMGRMCGVAITAYRRAHATMDDSVVVIGLGLVGNLAAQFFVEAGQRVIGLDISAKRRSLAYETGIHEAIDPTGLSDKELFEQVSALNYGRRPTIVVDAVGDSKIIERCVNLVAHNGRVIMLGTPRAEYNTDATVMLKIAHFHGVEIIGALEWTIPLLKRNSSGSVSTELNTELIFRMIGEGALKVKPLCSHVLPPSELDRAYQGLLHHKDDYLGVVLDWENNPTPAAAA